MATTSPPCDPNSGNGYQYPTPAGPTSDTLYTIECEMAALIASYPETLRAYIRRVCDWPYDTAPLPMKTIDVQEYKRKIDTAEALVKSTQAIWEEKVQAEADLHRRLFQELKAEIILCAPGEPDGEWGAPERMARTARAEVEDARKQHEAAKHKLFRMVEIVNNDEEHLIDAEHFQAQMSRLLERRMYVQLGKRRHQIEAFMDKIARYYTTREVHEGKGGSSSSLSASPTDADTMGARAGQTENKPAHMEKKKEEEEAKEDGEGGEDSPKGTTKGAKRAREAPSNHQAQEKEEPMMEEDETDMDTGEPIFLARTLSTME